MNAENIAYFKRVGELVESREPFASVMLVASRGHAPQDPGARILVTARGLDLGTVGGGRVEAKAITRAQEMLGDRAAPERELLTWNLQRDVGMTCGGEVTLYLEVFFCKQWRIAVFGAGHVAQSLVRLLLGIDCQITCIDPRPEWLERLPTAPTLRKICTQDMPAEIARLPADTYILLMTQGHAHDMPILKAALALGPRPYLGVIGSEVKGIRVRKELREAGFTEELVERVRCPMGLKLGRNAPNEIAISMVAELLQLRDLN